MRNGAPAPRIRTGSGTAQPAPSVPARHGRCQDVTGTTCKNILLLAEKGKQNEEFRRKYRKRCRWEHRGGGHGHDGLQSVDWILYVSGIVPQK